MNCPECGSEEKDLDWWIDIDGYWHWNCFVCEYKWRVHQDAMKTEKSVSKI